MIILNDVTRIGIARLIELVGVEKNYKESVEINGYNPCYCAKVNCAIYKKMNDKALPEEQRKIIIEDMCSCCPLSNKKIDIYHNEKNNYKISKELLLTKSRLQQFLLYHAICSTNGGCKKVSAKDISRELDFSGRTIKDNNKYFLENNLICTCKVNADQYGLFILGYKDYFKTKDEYGRGYIEIPKEIMLRLLNENNINSIRLTLRGLIINSKINDFKNTEIKGFDLSYKEIRRYLPGYINCPKKINAIIKKSLVEIFDTKISTEGINFVIKNEFDNNHLRLKSKELYSIKVVEHIYKKSRLVFGQGISAFDITNIDMYLDDFVQMCQQYNLDLVLKGIDYLLDFIDKTDFIGNYGGTVRNKITEWIYGKNQSLII